MKFYIDFEATQFTEQIISIGCIDEVGNSFYSLVKPQLENFKISNFITELTGISKNDLINLLTLRSACSNIIFIWSRDWWINKNDELIKIQNALLTLA